MGDIFGWRLFDFLWWVVDTIFSKCINRRFWLLILIFCTGHLFSITVTFCLCKKDNYLFSLWAVLLDSSQFNDNFFSFTQIRLKLLLLLFEGDWKVDYGVSHRNSFTVESYWGISHSFFSWSTKIHLFMNADVCFFFFLSFQIFRRCFC
jgi:hypothetical protein